MLAVWFATTSRAKSTSSLSWTLLANYKVVNRTSREQSPVEEQSDGPRTTSKKVFAKRQVLAWSSFLSGVLNLSDGRLRCFSHVAACSFC